MHVLVGWVAHACMCWLVGLLFKVCPDPLHCGIPPDDGYLFILNVCLIFSLLHLRDELTGLCLQGRVPLFSFFADECITFGESIGILSTDKEPSAEFCKRFVTYYVCACFLGVCDIERRGGRVDLTLVHVIVTVMLLACFGGCYLLPVPLHPHPPTKSPPAMSRIVQ